MYVIEIIYNWKSAFEHTCERIRLWTNPLVKIQNFKHQNFNNFIFETSFFECHTSNWTFMILTPPARWPQQPQQPHQPPQPEPTIVAIANRSKPQQLFDITLSLVAGGFVELAPRAQRWWATSFDYMGAQALLALLVRNECVFASARCREVCSFCCGYAVPEF